MTAKLRISHIIVQAVLVWDDGDELSPGPELKPASMPLSALSGFADTLPGEVVLLSKKLIEQDISSKN